MIKEIFLNHIKELNLLLKEKNIILELANNALNYFIEKGYSPQFGARQLKRIIEKDIKNLLADLMLTDKLSKNQKVQLYLDEFGNIDYRLSLLASVS